MPDPEKHREDWVLKRGILRIEAPRRWEEEQTKEKAEKACWLPLVTKSGKELR